MADYEYNAEEIDAEEDGVEREYTPTRDNVIFLIDVQTSMFQEAALKNTEGFQESDRWFDVAIKVAREFSKMHIISSDTDRIAVVFYGTRETRNQNNFENVFTLQDLEEPSAHSIRELDQMLGGAFEERVGSAPEAAPDHLRNGLWAASQLLSAASQHAFKRVLIFSADPNPAGSGPKAHDSRDLINFRAKALHEANVAVEVFPLVRPNEAFPMDFWNGIIHAADDGEGGAAFTDGLDTVYRLQTLPGLLRHKAYRKRTAGRARWHLPGGFQLAVAYYALLQPAAKGSPVFLNATNNQPLKVESALICQDTGAVLTDVPKRMFPKRDLAAKLVERFQPVFFTTEELREVKAVKDPGLYLLGFKPAELLRPWQTWRQSTFVYPDERAMAGSTTAFVALHSAMADADRVALCAYVRSKGAEARLVALQAAVEEKDELGEQVAPPGMHMLHLCFSDDIRTPEADPSLVGPGPHPAADEAQIAAAVAVVEKLHLGGAFVGMFENPVLQRHYQVLEALALAEPPPPLQDELQPDYKGLAQAQAEVERFKVLVYGEGHNEAGFGAKKPAAGKKRPNPEEEAALQEAMADTDYKGLAAKGQLGKLKVDDLKKYCKANGLKQSGKKDELVERVSEHVGKS